MLVQVDTLHKTDAYYVMDCDLRLPNRDRLPFPIVFKVQFNLANLTRPGIRVTLVSGGLKMVTGLERDHAAHEEQWGELIVFGTIHRTMASVYSHQLPCVGMGPCNHARGVARGCAHNARGIARNPPVNMC